MARQSARLKAALVLSTSLGLVHAAPAFSQAASAPAAAANARTSDSPSGDIIVTARRVEERLQDVPISITVFSQAQITKQNIANSNDLAIFTPSLGSSNPVGNEQSTFSLRGFNQEGSTAPTVAVMFADVVAPRGATNQSAVGDGAGPGSFFDLQNVQVLKGPQGTLFGRNTTGGAILLVPQKPTGKFEGYIEGSYGNFDMRRIQAVLNVPLSDSARLRLGVDRQIRDGYVRNYTGIGPDRFNDTDYWAARASLVVDLTPNLENYMIGTYTRSDSTGEANVLIAAQPAPDTIVPAGALGAGSPAFTIPGALTKPFAYLAQQELNRDAAAGHGFYSIDNTQPDPYSKLTQWQFINTTTWKASDTLTVKNIASYGQLTYASVNPVYAAAFNLADFNPYGQAFLDLAVNPSLMAAGAPRAIFRPYPANTLLSFTESNPRSLRNIADQSTFTEEFQLQGSGFGDKLTYQTGVYFEDSEPLNDSGSVSANLANCTPVALTCSNPFFGNGSVQLTDARKTIKTTGVYGQASYAITDKLKLTGGIRYTWDHQSVTGRLINYKIPYSFYTGGAIQTSDVNQTFVNTAGPFAASNAATCVIVTATTANGCVESVKQKSSAPTWLIDLDYKPTNNILAYAKWSRGYRTGGISFQMPPALRTYEPERVDAYEIGAKLAFHGAVRGTFNIAGFYNNFTNQQIAVGVNARVTGSATSAQGVVNAGKSRIYGAEVESSIELARGLVLGMSYAYLNTKITKLSYPTFNDPIYYLDTSRSPVVGDPLSFTSKNKVLASLNYTLPVDASVGRITVGGDFVYSSAQVTNEAFRDASGKLTGLSLLQPRKLVDLNVSWNGVAGSPIDLSVFANNVTNRKYYTYILDVGIGAQAAQLGQPRMYGGRIRYSFR